MSDDAQQLRLWRSKDSAMPRIIGDSDEVADVIATLSRRSESTSSSSQTTRWDKTPAEKRENMDRFLNEVAVHLGTKPSLD